MSVTKVIDVSHWNTLGQFKQNKDAKACIIKITEGYSYDDPAAFDWFNNATDAGMLVGAYHYARPDKGNTPMDEAVHFVNTLRMYIPNRDTKVLLALDWEGKSLKYKTEWAEKWLEKVYALTGIRPFIYTNHEGLKKLAETSIHLSEEYGLWYASPTGEPFKYSHPTAPLGWKVVAMHQYGIHEGIDVNAFNGTFEQLKKYATPAILYPPGHDSSTVEPDVTEETCTCFMCEDIRRLIREELEMQKQDK